MTLGSEQISEAVARYGRERDRYDKLAAYVHAECEGLIASNTVRAYVQSRVKAVNRLETKLQKKRASFGTVEDVFGESGLKDLAAVRVVTYVERDRQEVVSLIRDRFGNDRGGSVAVEMKDSQSKHYRATHCVLSIGAAGLPEGLDNIADTLCEVQVCSLLAHVWNEVEHDLVYKPLTGETSADEQVALDALGRLTTSGDSVLELLYSATDRRLAEQTGDFSDEHEFVVRTRGLFPEATDFGRNAGQLYEELVTCGYPNPQAVEALLAGKDRASLFAQLKTAVDEDGTSLVLEPGTSDELLVALLDEKAQLIVENAPEGRGRPRRIVSLAKRYLELRPR